ncbi:MAG: MATE family efflux transporter [Ruminococcaceae bacterium]|nr:MATE family efflux transporter [Oscillospiraceae bacterium]
MSAIKENKMGVMPVGRLLAGMAVPMMISMLVQALYNIVDSIYVSRLGVEALTAVSLSFPLQNLMIAFGAGTAVGINAILSRSLGEKNYKSANTTANTGIFINICTFVLFAVIGVFFSRTFFELQDFSSSDYDIAVVIESGVTYTTICLCASLGIFMQFCFERLLQSTGKTTLAMLTQLIGAIINIILDPVLIFGLGPIKPMGISGAAIATVIGQFVAAIIAIVLNITNNKEIKISIKGIIRPDFKTLAAIYKIGFPSIVMQSIGSVMTFLLNMILGSLTMVATTVFGVYFKLQSFVFMPIFGLNNGMVPIIAYNYGAKNEQRVKKTIKLSIISAVSIMLIGLTLFETIPHLLLSFFNADAQMLNLGAPAFRIIALHFSFAGFCIIAGSVCQAIGNPVHSLIVSVCRQLVVLIPSAWLLSLTGNVTLVWFAFPIAEIFSLTLSSIFLSKTMKKVTANIIGGEKDNIAKTS